MSEDGGSSPGAAQARSRRAARPRRPRRAAVSAGGVVYRKRGEAIEVILVGRPNEGLWALPKGTPEAGESLEATARREVREETGVDAEIVGRLGKVRYRFGDGDGAVVDKTVYHYLMQPVGAHTGAHDMEHEIVRWFDIHEAERLLTHQNQAHILHRAAELIARMAA
jgi:8-oxo-dGTP pyrophosphatase MutT (NUDIX family)